MTTAWNSSKTEYHIENGALGGLLLRTLWIAASCLLVLLRCFFNWDWFDDNGEGDSGVNTLSVGLVLHLLRLLCSWECTFSRRACATMAALY